MVRWAVFVFFVTVLFDVALRAAERGPGVVILCAEGGVYRLDGLLASAGPCVLHDRNGSVVTADAIVVYDAANAAP